MLSKNDIRDAVNFLLREEAEASLLRKDPDVYYGWVPPTEETEGYWVPATAVTEGFWVPPTEAHDGYWLGEADEKAAEYQLDLAMVGLKAAGENTWSDPENPSLVTAYELAKARVESCRKALDEVKAYRDRVISGRREQLINRRVAKLFLKTYRKAVKLDWDLYNPAIPQSLRDYCLRQLARGPLAPVSVVFLYLSVQSTIAHGEDFQTQAITGQDYLVDNPLVSGGLDIDVAEDAPKAKQRRAYIRELQAQAIRDRRAPAHENRDPRDVLADFEYHGLPEQLGAMWINKDENCCDHCKQGVRVRMIHTSSGYRYATVCPNFRDDPKCHYELESPEFKTRKALRQWAMIEYATKQAA